MDAAAALGMHGVERKVAAVRAAFGGGATRERSLPGGPPIAPAAVVREGERVWVVGAEGRVEVPDGFGLRCLETILARPDEECASMDIALCARHGVAPGPRPARSAGDAGEMLDRQAVAAYRRRLEVLRANAGAGAPDDGEIGVLERELARGVGLGGRRRRAGSDFERARVNVTRALGRVLRTVARRNPALGRHLTRAVRTGTFCAYLPARGR